MMMDIDRTAGDVEPGGRALDEYVFRRDERGGSGSGDGPQEVPPAVWQFWRSRHGCEIVVPC